MKQKPKEHKPEIRKCDWCDNKTIYDGGVICLCEKCYRDWLWIVDMDR